MMPAPMILLTHSPASSEEPKPDQHGAGGFGLAQDAHRDLGDHPEEPLGAGHHAEQIVAARVEMLAADPHDLTGDQHQLAAEQVIRGHPVFEAMHPAGILRHVAADGAGDLRGWIGRVVEAGMLDCLRHRQIGDARLDDDDPIGEIDLADTIELGHAQENAVGQRQGATRERGARPARHHLDALRVTEAQHPAHLLGGFGQHDHHGQRAVGGQPIGFVGAHFPLGRYHALTRNDGPQRRHDAVAAGKHRLIQRRHRHGHGRAPAAARTGRGPFVAPCL